MDTKKGNDWLPFRLSEAKKINDPQNGRFPAFRLANDYARLTVQTLEPYAIQSGKYIQKQWNLLLKYIEGPVYDKSVEIAEQVRRTKRDIRPRFDRSFQIQKLSIVIFKRSAHYLSIFFDHASYYAAHAAHATELYLKQFSATLYDQWTQ